MTVIHLGPPLPGAQATYPRTRRAASSSAYLVLLRMEVAAFHPHPLDRMRLVSVALFLVFTARSRGGLMASGRYPASRSSEPGLSSPGGAKSRCRQRRPG